MFVCDGCAGDCLIGPLLTGPWFTPVAEYGPLSRTTFPYIFRWLVTPDCASAGVAKAIRQTMVRRNFMNTPRFACAG